MTHTVLTTEETVSAYIARHNMLDLEKKHIVALSGGADSVALLLIMQSLGYDVEAAHCNFHLRGDESCRDERFVRELCGRRGVPFHTVHFATADYASLHKVSIEMAARELRYRHFEQLRRDIGAADICVAHHSDDSVETLLMNLVRGTGIHGLAGIRPVNGYIRRPLLCLSRSDIEGYLSARGQAYVTDSTNLVADVTRNKFRLNIIPLLKEINPSAADNIRRTAEYVSEAVRVFDDAMAAGRARVTVAGGAESISGGAESNGAEPAGDESRGVIIDVSRLSAEPSPECLLHSILGGYGFTPSQVEQVYAGIGAPSSGRVYRSPRFDLLIDRGRIIIEPQFVAAGPLKMPEPGVYVIAGGRRLSVSIDDIDSGFVLPRSAAEVCLDASGVRFPLTLRPAVAGDRFVPFGMRGSKLVSDYLTDRKRTLFEKRRSMVLTSASGEIIWLVGERPDNRFRITERSRRAVRLKVFDI